MQDFTQFAPADFSLWAQPSADSQIQDRAKNPAPLDPTQASPMVQAADQPLHDDGANSDMWDAGSPQSAQSAMPAAQDVPVPPQQSRLGRLHDALASHFTGDTPKGYEGILTPEEIQAAKPSLLHSMFSLDTNENGKQQWQTNLDRMVAHKQQLAGIAQNQRIMQQRQQIFAKNPAPDASASEDQQVQWARARALDLMSIGDYQGVQQMAQHFGSLFKQFNPNAKPATGTPYVNTQTGETRLMSNEVGTSIGPEWKKVPTSSGNAGDKLLVNPKTHDMTWLAPGDNDRASKLASQGYIETTTAREQDVQGNTNARHSDSDVVGLQKNFRGDVKDLGAQGGVYDKALYTMNKALNSTDPDERKLLFGAVKSQFVQSSDQAKNLRFQLLQYYEHNIDPSFSGTAEQMWDKVTQGKVPDRLLKAMIQHVYGLQQETRAQIEARRQGFLNSNAGRLDATDLPATDTYFPFQDQYKNLGTPSTGNASLDAYIAGRKGKK